MKKSLLNIMALALTVVNLVLTIVLVFAIVPSMKKTDNLITKICTVLDFELENSSGIPKSEIDVPMEDIDVYNFSQQMTINLKTGEDGKDHWAVLSVSLSMNTKNKDYGTYGGTLEQKESLIRNKINSIVSAHTRDEMKNNTEAIQDEILKAIQDMFRSDFIIGVNFSEITVQ